MNIEEQSKDEKLKLEDKIRLKVGL